jgi:hypothetical protein
VIGDAHNRHLGVTLADYRPKPALDALSFTNRLFAGGFHALDSELRVLSPPSAALELRGFVTARRTLVVIAWIKTHPASCEVSASSSLRNVRDERRELVRLSVPYTPRGPCTLYDARGRARGISVPSEPSSGRTELSFDVSAGQVQLLELPIAVE